MVGCNEVPTHPTLYIYPPILIRYKNILTFKNDSLSRKRSIFSKFCGKNLSDLPRNTILK